MSTTLNTLATLSNLSSSGTNATDLYARISKNLLAHNASVQKINTALERDKTRLSGLGQLQSALANFQALAQSVSGVGLQTAATPSNPAVLSALTTGSAKPGNVDIEVQQLAQAQVLAAQAQASQTQPIGSGEKTTIRIETGVTSGSNFDPKSAKTITIDSSNNSLQGIAAAFKAAGIDAQISKTGNSYALELSGGTGSANSLRISVGGDSDLQKLLAYNPAGAKNLSAKSSAQDARLTIDGKSVTSDSNVVTGQIAGVALALKATGKTSVVVAQDASAIGKNVANFVTAVNNANARLDELKKGELKSDASLKQAQDQLQQLLKNNEAALAKVGISTRNGALQIDSKVLNAAVAADADGVARLFTNNGKGIADQAASKFGQLIGNNGAISKQKQVIGRELTTLATQQSNLTKALEAQANSLVTQYSQIGQGSTFTNGNGGSASLFDFLA
jgi:flagellar hook-associated protein 2